MALRVPARPGAGRSESEPSRFSPLCFTLATSNVPSNITMTVIAALINADPAASRQPVTPLGFHSDAILSGLPPPPILSPPFLHHFSTPIALSSSTIFLIAFTTFPRPIGSLFYQSSHASAPWHLANFLSESIPVSPDFSIIRWSLSRIFVAQVLVIPGVCF